jgi:hypothetical protein
MRAPVAVAVARLRARPGRALLVVIGVAAATGLLAGVIGGGLAARDRALQQALTELPVSQRSFRVSSYDLPIGKSYPATDRIARAALSRVSEESPTALTQFPTLRIDHELVRLAGLNRLPEMMRLRSGRWPAGCRPARCEVVQVGPGAKPRLDEGGIHLVRVGFARLTDPDLSEVVGAGPPLLFAGAANAFERLPAFQGISRNYLWTAPLDPKSVHVWRVADILAAESAAQGVLAAGGETFALAGPDAALQAAQRDGRVASQRMVLVGGEISALLLGFALVAAVGLRRGVWNESRRLGQRGARRGQVWLAVATEVGAITLAGVVCGLALGAIAVAALARVASLPAGALLDHSLATTAGLGIGCGAWIVATVAIVIAVRTPERRRTGGVRPIDVAAVGALVAVVLAVTSADATAGASSSRSRLLYTVLPGLVCFAAAVAAGRLLGPAMRLGERLSRGAAAALHLAFLALARAPARTVATVGFLLVSIGLALFAASYRGTLEDGARDEAAYAVPLDFTLTEGPRLVLPLDAAPLARYQRVAPGASAYPVLRRTASVAGQGTSVLSPTVLGLPAAAISKLHWRPDFSKLSPRSISELLGAGRTVSLRGAPIPPGTRTLGVTAGVQGIPVRLELVVEDSRGRLRTLLLGERGPGTFRLTTRTPASARQVVALQASLGTLAAHELAHREAGGESTFSRSGSTTLGPLTADGVRGRALVTDWAGWIARGGGQRPEGGAARLTYTFLLDQSVVLRLPQPTDGRPLRVLVSPDVARSAPPDGAITLDFQDARVPARIVGVADRFPDADTIGEGFVVADESHLATALGADAPGTSTPDELWLSGPAAVEQALRRPPFAALVLSSRRDLQRALATRPLARGITWTLGAAGLIALLLAAVGMWVTLVSDARDERGELFDLEAQGVPPGTLRNQLRLRSAVLVGFGTIGGLVLGLVLSRLVVSVVSVSAETTAPVPPLRYEPAWPTVLAVLALLAVLVAALTELTVRQALRGKTPPRGAWSLE